MEDVFTLVVIVLEECMCKSIINSVINHDISMQNGNFKKLKIILKCFIERTEGRKETPEITNMMGNIG